MANKKVSQLTSKPSVLTTDLFPIADPSTGQLFKTTISDLGTAIGSGVSSVNTLVGAVVLDTDDIQELVSPTNKWFTDTRARAAISASSPLTYNSGTGAFGIQVATGSQNGYLSSTDWTTFNAKQAALSGTGFVKSTGGTISYDTNTYLTTSAAASTYLALAGGTLTGTLLGTSAGFTGYVGIGNTSPLYQLDVTGSGRFEGDLRIESTNPRIYLTDSDNNPDYFISNTDGTFTIYDVTNSSSRLTISSSQISPRLPIVSNSSIQGTAFYSDSFFSATTFVQATTFMASPSYRLTGGTSPTGLYFGHTDKVVLANYTVGGGIDFETNGGNITMQLSSSGVLSTTGGASFSGALSGTSASFSSTLSATGNVTIGNAVAGTNVKLIFNGVASKAAGIEFHQSGTAQWYLGNGIASEDNNFELYNSNGTMAMKIIKSTNAINFQGAATFSSSVTANSNIETNNGYLSSSAGTGTSYSSRLSTVYNYPFVDTYLDSIAGASYEGRITFRTNSAGGSMTTRMLINNSGEVMINQTSPTAGKLQVTGLISSSGSAASYLYQDQTTGVNWQLYANASTCRFYNSAAGIVANIIQNTGVYVATSDVNKKKDFEESKIGLAEVLQLKPTFYRMKTDSESEEKQLGFIAQEVKGIIPSAYQESGDFIGLNFNPIVAALTKAIQELKVELDTLKNK